ncbi:phosphate transporter [Nematocida major]|uniref:phosphate transporter n=1 Tax=Nematocida major TaxID=1912982 RepID=UPI002007D1DA|nr:phosphate transporter [Nematocida major]KAH9385473.1 phosphate transporter [Nematocida major]
MQLDSVSGSLQASPVVASNVLGPSLALKERPPAGPEGLDARLRPEGGKALHFLRENALRVTVACFFVVLGITFYLFMTAKHIGVFPTQSACICCVIACLASIFWSFHILPLDVTALLLIPVVVASNTLAPGMLASSLVVLRILVSPVVLLLMGSCLLSVYFESNGGARLVLPYLISSSGPQSTLFKSMLLSLTLSSVMSNVTAPIIIMSVLQSTMKVPDPSVVMGIAMASNIGGMILPISSPQSILGAAIIKVSWARWLFISVPTAAACFAFVYTLIVSYFPKKQEGSGTPVVMHEQGASNKKLIVVTAMCILCWAIPSLYRKLQWVYALPVCALLIAKSARKACNRKTLEVLSIAVAGTSIGKGIERTKMLEGMISRLLIGSKERSLLFLVIGTSFIMLFVSCIVCHTVSAVVLLPIFEKIGMFIGREKIIVGVASLVCSCGMAFPSSGFPNIISSSAKSPSGKRLIDLKTFIFVGSVSTIGCWIFILTVSLTFMTLANF